MPTEFSGHDIIKRILSINFTCLKKKTSTNSTPDDDGKFIYSSFESTTYLYNSALLKSFSIVRTSYYKIFYGLFNLQGPIENMRHILCFCFVWLVCINADSLVVSTPDSVSMVNQRSTDKNELTSAKQVNSNAMMRHKFISRALIFQ